MAFRHSSVVKDCLRLLRMLAVVCQMLLLMQHIISYQPLLMLGCSCSHHLIYCLDVLPASSMTTRTRDAIIIALQELRQVFCVCVKVASPFSLFAKELPPITPPRPSWANPSVAWTGQPGLSPALPGFVTPGLCNE